MLTLTYDPNQWQRAGGTASQIVTQQLDPHRLVIAELRWQLRTVTIQHVVVYARRTDGWAFAYEIPPLVVTAVAAPTLHTRAYGQALERDPPLPISETIRPRDI